MKTKNKPGLVEKREPGNKTESQTSYTTFAELDISTKRSSGEEKTLCPKCSHKRKKQSEPCLAVNHDDGVYCCHHCDWKGCLKNGNGNGYRAKSEIKETYDYPDESKKLLYQTLRKRLLVVQNGS